MRAQHLKKTKKQEASTFTLKCSERDVYLQKSVDVDISCICLLIYAGEGEELFDMLLWVWSAANKCSIHSSSFRRSAMPLAEILSATC